MPTNVCRYIRINGARCGSPSLHGKTFCYYHIRLTHHHSPAPVDNTPVIIHPIPKDHLDRMQREPILAEYYSGALRANQRAAQPELDLPPLEDRHAIQLAISMLVNAMAHNRIDLPQATGLLYGLQVASANAKDLIPAPTRHQRTGKVRQTVLHESGLEIALDEDPEDSTEEDYEPKGPAARFIEKLEREKLEKERLAAERERAAAEQERLAAERERAAAEQETAPATQDETARAAADQHNAADENREAIS